MIAYRTSVCYSGHMRKMVVCALVVLSAGILYTSGLLAELSFFLIAGKIPFTTLFIPATAMMFFWILIVPLSLLFRASIVALFWASIETMGQLHQRQLNRRSRQSLLAKQYTPLLHLYVVALLTLPRSSTQKNSVETTALRRRFAALQM